MTTPWEPEFTREVGCSLCGNAGRPVLRAKEGGRPGVCEACAVEARWCWHEVPRDSDPSHDGPPSPARVRVLVPRLALVPGARPDAPQSYEVAMRKQGDGLDLPAADVVPGETDAQAAERALEPLGLATFAPCVEVLYEAHSASGDFVRVLMVTAFTVLDKKLAEWRPWPPWEHARETAGLYLALRSVFELRLWKYQAREPRLGAVAVEVRRGAAEYVRTQQELRGKEGCERDRVDTSMLPLLRQGMSDDERAVATLVCAAEEVEAEARAEAAEAVEESAAKEPAQPDLFGPLPKVGSRSAPAGEPATLEEAFEDGEPDIPF